MKVLYYGTWIVRECFKKSVKSCKSDFMKTNGKCRLNGKYEILLLLLICLAGFAAVAEDGVDASKLEERTAVVRVYPKWMEDGETFEKVTVAVVNGAIRWADVKAADDCLIVLRGEDQDDEVVRQAVGDVMFVRRSAQKADFYLTRGQTAGLVRQRQLVSGTGEALGGARVEVYLRLYEIYEGYRHPGVFFGAVELGPSGLLKLPEVRGFLTKWELVVYHPKYGTCMVKEISRLDKRRVVRLPFVKIGSAADEFSIWGTVVDSNGTPVSGAVVESERVYTPGGGALIPKSHNRVISDEAGNFAMYSLLKEGSNIPVGSSYGIVVAGPKGSGLGRYSGKVVVGEQSSIVLERRALKFRQFVFERNGREMTNVEVLKKIRVDIWDDSGKDSHYYGDWKDGGYFPAGVYRVGTKRRFSDAVVTADSGELVVFRESKGEQTTYGGRVVNAVTGEPMAGIMVCAGYLYDGQLHITAEQWQAIRAIEGRVSGDEKALGPLKGSFNRFCKATRTDDEGWYELDYDSLKDIHFWTIFAFEENYYARGILRPDVKVDSDGYGETEPLVLFPSGKVLFEPNVAEPGRGFEIDVRVKVDGESVSWAHAASGFSQPDEFAANKKASMLVPAGVKMRLEFCPQDHHAGANQPLSKKVFVDMQLEQGEVLDLGRFVFEETIPVFVQLTDPVGRGVGEVNVGNKYNTNSRYFDSLADANGLASFRVSPKCTGTFYVRHEISRENFLRESLDYKVSGIEDANTVFEFGLSEVLVKRLLRED